MRRHHFFLILAGILYGGIVPSAEFFAQRGLSLFEIAFWSTLFPAVILFTLILKHKERWLKKEHLTLMLLYGFIGALLALSQFGAVILGVPIAIVALLLYTQPIWTTVFSKLFFKEAVTLRKVLAVVTSFLGIIILVRPWDVGSIVSVLGLLIALFGGLLLSLWIIVGKVCENKGQHPIGTAFGYNAFSALWILILWPVASALISDQSIVRLSINFSPSIWVWILVITLLTRVLPHVLFYTAIKKAEALVVGVIIMLEPISAAIIAAVAFGQAIGLEFFIGGALILLSNYVIVHESGGTK